MESFLRVPKACVGQKDSKKAMKILSHSFTHHGTLLFMIMYSIFESPAMDSALLNGNADLLRELFCIPHPVFPQKYSDRQFHTQQAL